MLIYKKSWVYYVLLYLFLSYPVIANNQPIDKIKLNREDTTVITPTSNRLPPPYIENVTIEGVSHYLDNVRDHDLIVSTTFLIAVDQSYQEQWRLAVYKTHFDKMLETDIQEVYAVSLDYNRDKHSFIIENENGEIFTVDLKTFEVKMK